MTEKDQTDRIVALMSVIHSPNVGYEIQKIATVELKSWIWSLSSANTCVMFEELKKKKSKKKRKVSSKR